MDQKLHSTQPDLLSCNDLMARGYNRTLVYQWLNREDMPVVKIGRRRYMHRELFDEWLRKQAVNHD